MDPGRFIKQLSAAREPSPLRALFYMPRSPNMIDLTGGLPNPTTFAFKQAEFLYNDGTICSLDERLMNEAQQYAATLGIARLRSQLREIQEKIHRPAMKEWEISVTLGCQDAMCKSFEMILETGDYVIIEKATYPGTINIIRPYSPRYIIVENDEHGMKPESLLCELQKRWPTAETARNAQTDFPKVLYCVPTGSNPCGVNWTESRKRAVYKIAQEYDFLIIEDDPYYYLNYESEDFPPSFLSLDTDGRVIRCDSFSKILSSGIRVGFCTAHPKFIDRISKHMEISTMHCPVLCQVLVAEFLNKLQFDGFVRHTKSIKRFYMEKRAVILSAAEKHLAELAEWYVPKGGYFLWMKIKNLENTYNMIMNRSLAHNVRLVPGCWFMVDGSPSSYLRASFSMITPEIVDEAFRNLANMIREELHTENC